MCHSPALMTHLFPAAPPPSLRPRNVPNVWRHPTSQPKQAPINYWWKRPFTYMCFFLIFYSFFFFRNDTWRGGGTDGAQSDVTAEGERAEVPQYCRWNKGTFIINLIFQYSIASWDVVADLPTCLLFICKSAQIIFFFPPCCWRFFPPQISPPKYDL